MPNLHPQKLVTLYRVAAVLIVAFSAGHTAGMLLNRSQGPEADAVLASMKSVHFAFNGTSRTFYDFFFSFGLVMTVFLLYSAFTAWRLSSVEPPEWPVVAPLAWGLFVVHAAVAYFAWAYFFAGPGVLESVAALLLGGAAFRKSRPA